MLRSIGKQSVESVLKSLTHWTEFGFVVNWIIITSWAVIARICCRRVSVSICLSVCLSQIGRISGVSNGWVRCAVACEHILSISMSFPTTVERLSSYTTDKTKQLSTPWDSVPGPPLHAAVDSFCAHALFAWWRSGQGIGLSTLNVASSTPGLALSGNNLRQDCSGSMILYIFFSSTENISVL